MVKLTKKFENEGLVGQDPAKGLQRALDRQGANVGPTILGPLSETSHRSIFGRQKSRQAPGSKVSVMPCHLSWHWVATESMSVPQGMCQSGSLLHHVVYSPEGTNLDPDTIGHRSSLP